MLGDYPSCFRQPQMPVSNDFNNSATTGRFTMRWSNLVYRWSEGGKKIVGDGHSPRLWNMYKQQLLRENHVVFACVGSSFAVRYQSLKKLGCRSCPQFI